MSKTLPLIELFGKKFHIPHYQRGFRWGEQEVVELLDDLLEFSKPNNKGLFYCLQPIVVLKKGENTYDVLDGQQRLTSLFLILMYLEDRRIEDNYQQEIFTLKYETRKKSEKFLKEKMFQEGVNEENIDFFHISSSYQFIHEWFKRNPGAKGDILPVLMKDNNSGNKNVRFIWYEVENDENPINIFIRLNVGKIPLTDAELVKALLLQMDKYDEKNLPSIKGSLFEIASEWDEIEYSLQRDDFWYFLNNDENHKETHIEYIFNLLATRYNQDGEYFQKKPLKYSTFLIFSKKLEKLINDNGGNRLKAVKTIWEDVIEYSEYFKNWFDNRELFHHIGYLITWSGPKIIDELIGLSKSLTKTEFQNHLAKKVFEHIDLEGRRKDLQFDQATEEQKEINVLLSLEYEDDNGNSKDKYLINKFLLLHNIHTTFISDKEMARFPFNLFKATKKRDKWSLEHIHAQQSETIKNEDQQRLWLKDHIKSLSTIGTIVNEELILEMQDLLLMDQLDTVNFDFIVERVHKIYNDLSGIEEGKLHSIDNLCLVDQPTNSQLNNSVFDVKREKIKEREVNGHYIPICTRNLFLKAYTPFPKNSGYWDKEDRVAYLNNLQKTYQYYLAKSNSN